MKRLILLLSLALPLSAVAQRPCTVKDEMDRIGEIFSIYFVYDAELPVNTPTTFSVDPGKSLQKNLRGLFEDTNIVWRVRSPYVVLARCDTVLPPAPVWPEPEWERDPAPVVDTLAEAVKTARLQLMLPTGGYQFDPALTRNVVTPLGEGDAFKYAQTLPGVSAGGEGVTAFHVRGGNMGSNAITLDGVPIYGISHLMGLTSVMPGDVIGISEFQAGGFRSDAGNFTASHLDMKSYTGDFERARARFTVNPFMSSASVSTPLEKGRSSFLGSVRYSPVGLMYKAFKKAVDRRQDTFEDMGATVGDFYGKFTVRPDNRNEIAFSLFGSLDNYRFDMPSINSETKYIGWSNVIAQLSWDTHQAAGFDHIHSALSLNDHRWNKIVQYQFNPEFFNGNEAVSMLDEVMLQSTGSRSWERWSMRAGVQLRGGRFNPGSFRQFEIRLDPGRNGRPYRKETSREDNLTWSLLSTLHGEVEYAVPERLLLRFSLRGNLYSAKRMPFSWSPWVADDHVRYDNGDESTYTHFHPEVGMLAQVHLTSWLGIEGTLDYRTQYYHSLEEMRSGWAFDPIVASENVLPPERALQGYLGVFGGVDGHAFRAGGFYKQIWDLVYKKKMTGINDYYDDQAWREDLVVGNGNAYGAEIFYAKEGRDLSWQFSYTWSKTDRRFPDIAGGVTFPARYDRRHMLHASARWKGLNAAFTLQSGHNETISIYQYFGGNEMGEIINVGEPYNWRVPAFIRFDAGYRFTFRSGKDRAHLLNHNLTIGVYNLFNRRNTAEVSFDNTEMKWKQISYFPIMPSITYQLEL